MSILGNLFASALDLAVVPVEVVKDIATLGGTVIGNDETYTGARLREAGRHFQNAIDESAGER